MVRLPNATNRTFIYVEKNLAGGHERHSESKAYG